MKIEIKNWKSGTYAITQYYIDGEELTQDTERQENCGFEWFTNLPESEEEAEKKDITSNTPYWLDDLIEREREGDK